MTVENANQTDRQLLTEYATGKSEEAFAELVRRHGPMVLGVCRQMLRNEQDAEDTFQAIFMVLARKAGSITSPEALSNWLYSVTTRMATRNRVAVNRRHAREVPLTDSQSSAAEGQQGELRRLLAEEIGRLPDRYRVPFVLCYLDGKTNEEAAKLLRCPPGTVFSRLARARERLRVRLGRQGVVVTSGLVAAVLSTLPRDVFAAISTQLLRKTARSALRFSADRATGTAGASARIAKLARQEIATWSAPWIRMSVAALLATAVIGTGAGILIRRTSAEKAVNKTPDSGANNTAASAVDNTAANSADPKIVQQLKGAWILKAMTIDGKPFQFATSPTPRVTYGDDGTVVAGAAGTYRLDTRTRPMQMYWTMAGRVTPGIFELQGDSLTLCLTLGDGGLPSLPLPTDFMHGPGKSVMIYSRERP